jgi:hypothetical protein
MKHFVRLPSPAMAVAFLALVLVAGGTAIALPGKGSVDSGDIKNNTIRSKDVRNSSLSGKDFKNGRLQGKDLKNGSVSGADVDESSLAKVPSATIADAATTLTPRGFVTLTANPGWGPTQSPNEYPPAMYKDREGFVHLRGAVGRFSGTSTVPLTLPVGSRPGRQVYFLGQGQGNATKWIRVDPNGAVNVEETVLITLDMVQFRAEG